MSAGKKYLLIYGACLAPLVGDFFVEGFLPGVIVFFLVFLVAGAVAAMATPKSTWAPVTAAIRVEVCAALLVATWGLLTWFAVVAGWIPRIDASVFGPEAHEPDRSNPLLMLAAIAFAIPMVGFLTLVGFLGAWSLGRRGRA